MAAFGTPDATGRSSGKLDRRERKLLGPPKGEPWVWLPAALLASPAWRGMSVNCCRFISFLMAQHCRHAGRRNGDLIATYSRLAVYGIRRGRIRTSIEEAVRRGLVEVTGKGGLYGAECKRTPSTYRLTWIGCVNPKRDATSDWQKFEEKFISPDPTAVTASDSPGVTGEAKIG